MNTDNEVVRLHDVGVAGIHRLLRHLDELMNASVVIAIAGMEGALASVVSGFEDHGSSGRYADQHMLEFLPELDSFVDRLNVLGIEDACLAGEAE